jgi:hypothetical protein
VPAEARLRAKADATKQSIDQPGIAVKWIASSQGLLAMTLMDLAHTARTTTAVIVRLDRTTQYSRDVSD